MGSVSIVVPAYNEIERLPLLVRCLRNQSVRPAEIIVADGFSSDGTRRFCDREEIRVVDGGNPSTARNAGAEGATGEYLLFLDADTAPSAGLIEALLGSARSKNADVVSCKFCPIESGMALKVLFRMVSGLFALSTRLGRPRGLGGCLLVRRCVHRRLGGFDERIRWGEDLDYIERAIRCGYSYAFTNDVVHLSARRFIGQGIVRTCALYFLLDFARTRSGNLTSTDFGYFSNSETAAP